MARDVIQNRDTLAAVIYDTKLDTLPDVIHDVIQICDTWLDVIQNCDALSVLIHIMIKIIIQENMPT